MVGKICVGIFKMFFFSLSFDTDSQVLTKKNEEFLGGKKKNEGFPGEKKHFCFYHSDFLITSDPLRFQWKKVHNGQNFKTNPIQKAIHRWKVSERHERGPIVIVCCSFFLLFDTFLFNTNYVFAFYYRLSQVFFFLSFFFSIYLLKYLSPSVSNIHNIDGFQIVIDVASTLLYFV